MAGNNKDEPREIPRLLDAIVDGADLAIGSRYLAGGAYGGDMPRYRKWATRLHPRLLSWACGKKLTESTNGFRAIRLSCLSDERINLNQKWLDGYALEIYLLYKMIRLGYPPLRSAMHQNVSGQESWQYENEADRRLVGHAAADFFARVGIEALMRKRLFRI